MSLNKTCQEKWNGMKKAVTFSFDDGVTQDVRLIEILNRYGLKGTFNINSELLGLPGQLNRNGKIVSHNKISPCDLRYVYEGHEVAAHTLTHPNLTGLDETEIIRQVEEDRVRLSELCGYAWQRSSKRIPELNMPGPLRLRTSLMCRSSFSALTLLCTISKRILRQ